MPATTQAVNPFTWYFEPWVPKEIIHVLDSTNVPAIEIDEVACFQRFEKKEDYINLFGMAQYQKIQQLISAPEEIVEDKNNLFRPTEFSQYIGQSKAKRIFTKYLEVITRDKIVMPHILLHGNAGCGKTTLAKIIAHKSNKKLVEIIGTDIKRPQDLKEIINKINGGILFIDEVHGIKRNIAECLYPVMEDFKLDGKRIPAFTLIGATTEYGEILKNRKPFCDRFKITVELENYTTAEMEQLLIQYWQKALRNKKISKKTFGIIAENSRLTPRIAIRLLEATAYFNDDPATALDNYNIIKSGYTTKDIKILGYLKSQKSCGIDSICAFANIPATSYAYEVEPYLLQTGVIMRTSTGRQITKAGRDLLASV